MKTGIFGPRILGKERFEEEKKIKKAKADIYGPRVTGHGIYKGPINKLSARIDSNYMSLPKMAETVTANPALVGKLLDMEMKRKSGPRSKALRLLKYAEQDKAKPDMKVLETIETELEAILEKAGLNPDEPESVDEVTDEVIPDDEEAYINDDVADHPIDISEDQVFSLADEDEDEEEDE